MSEKKLKEHISRQEMKKKAFWASFIKVSKAAGFSNLHVLGLCTLAQGGAMESDADPIIYEELYKTAEEDAAIKNHTRLQNSEEKAETQLEELLNDQQVQTSRYGSPLQDAIKKYDDTLAQTESDQEMQYEGEGPVDRKDIKEAAFKAGFDSVLLRGKSSQ